MDTSIFRYVLEVEKYRNITQAAKRLFISATGTDQTAE